jgi:ABC-type branched-subunit amino acid transport system substrate-binding protein
MSGNTTRIATALFAMLCLGANTVLAEPKYDPGASDTEIRIGNTAPYSGPASTYGTIGKTHIAFFEMINDRGGINGRRITFISLDDGYSPPKTVEQVRRLVEHDEVLLLFQTLGTPTNSAIHKYINRKQVPHLFVATGASKFGQPEEYPWTMGWQPAYPIEGKAFARYILENVEDPKIGVLFQNDDYGKDFLAGLKAGLGDRADDLIVAAEPYEVTDPTVESQIVTLAHSGANVFYNISIPKFAAQAIRKVHDIGWQPLHLLNYVSASVQATLVPAGLEKCEGIISALFVKDPSWEGDDVIAYRAFMEEYYPQGDPNDYNNGYAYAVASTLVHVLEQAGDDLTRANIMKKAAEINGLQVPMLMDGITVDTGPDDFYPIEQVVLARFGETEWLPFGDVISGR